MDTSLSLTPTQIPYVTQGGRAGWPDAGPPRYVPVWSDDHLVAVLQRQQRYPFPLAPATGDAAATATLLAGPPTITLATPATPGQANAFAVTRCGPRPEAPAILLPGFEVQDGPGGEQVVVRATDCVRCPPKDQTTYAALMAPVVGATLTVAAAPTTAQPALPTLTAATFDLDDAPILAPSPVSAFAVAAFAGFALARVIRRL